MRTLRQLLALAILANAALANANVFSDFLIQRPIGGVVLLDDGRHTSITTVVPLDKTLFAERNNRMPYAQEEIQSKLKTLSEGVHAQCARLSRIESDDRQLPLAEFVRDSSKMDAEFLDKVFGKYRRIFDALFKTANDKITLEKLSSQPAIGKAIRKVMEEQSATKAVDKDIIVEAKGCTAEDKLILQITIPFVAEQHTVKLYEVVDAGRFVAGRVAYARIDMPRQWVNLATPETDAKWAVVDLEKCDEMQDGKKGCPDEAIMPTTECTPADVNGCPLDVKFVAEDTNFVEEFALSNGSYIIATNMQEFKRMLSEPKVESVPSSGVMLANVTGCRMAFGERKVPRALPNATSSEKTCGFMGLSTKPAMEFDDITFTDKPVDPTEWAFFLSLSTEEGMPTTAFIMARPAGFCYETMRFVAANMWWFIALALMVSLSAMFTFFVVNRRISAETVRFIREKYGRGSVSSDDTSDDSLKTDLEGKKHRPLRNYFQAHLPTIKISGRKTSRADTERVSGMSEERRHHFYQKLIDMIPMMPSGKHADVTDEEAPAPVALDMPIKEEQTCLIQSEDETKPTKDTTPIAPIAPIVTSKSTPITADSAIVKVGPVARDIPEMPTKKNIYKETIDKLLKRAAIMHAQPKPQANEMLVDIFAIAELLRHQTVADEDLQKFRDELLTKYHSKEDGNSDAMRMNLVDFLKLTQFGTEITREQYDEMPQKGISLEDCRRLQFALRGLRVHAFGRSYRFFNLAKQFPNTFCPPNQPEENKLTVAEMFKRQQGIVLRFPMLPMVRLANGSHPNAEAPMEMVQVVAKRELLFASIRLARLNSNLHKTYVETTKRVNAQFNKKKTFPKKKEEKPEEAAKPEAPKDEKKEVAE